MSNLWGVSAAHPDSANPAGCTPCCEVGVCTHLWFDATCHFLSPAAFLSIKSTTEPVKKKEKENETKDWSPHHTNQYQIFFNWRSIRFRQIYFCTPIPRLYTNVTNSLLLSFGLPFIVTENSLLNSVEHIVCIPFRLYSSICTRLDTLGGKKRANKSKQISTIII